jgi:hypothetical protein
VNFHLELLTQSHRQQNMPQQDAKEAALKRFGNVQQIKDECLAISKRSSPFLRAFKSLLTVVFVGGVLVRFFGTELDVRHVGDLLIALPILSCLLLYVRGKHPSRPAKHETTSPLMLNDIAQEPFTTL